jgi:hypothetical protein
MNLPRMAVLTALIGFSTIGNAATVRGMVQCDVWNKDLQSMDGANYMADNYFLFGLLDGAALIEDMNFLKSVKPDFIGVWMDKYCKSHPSDSVGQGAEELIFELMKKQEGKNEGKYRDYPSLTEQNAFDSGK